MVCLLESSLLGVVCVRDALGSLQHTVLGPALGTAAGSKAVPSLLPMGYGERGSTVGCWWGSLLARGLSMGARRGFQPWFGGVKASQCSMPRHGRLTSPKRVGAQTSAQPAVLTGTPDSAGRAAGRCRAGWTGALRRARPGGRSSTKPRLSLRCSSAASLPRGVRRPPGLPRAVPARRAAAARPRGARGLPRPRGRAALLSPPLRREIARSPGLGCAEGRTAAGGARGCGCPEMGCASSRLCLYTQCAAARVTLPGGSSRWAALGGGGVGVGFSLFFSFLFSPPRCSREGSGCHCVPLTHLAGGRWSAWQSLGVVLVFSLRKLQIFISVHASFTVLQCPCQQSLGLCCKVTLLHPS